MIFTTHQQTCLLSLWPCRKLPWRCRQCNSMHLSYSFTNGWMNGELKFPDRLSFRCDFCVFPCSAISDFHRKSTPFWQSPWDDNQGKSMLCYTNRTYTYPSSFASIYCCFENWNEESIRRSIEDHAVFRQLQFSVGCLKRSRWVQRRMSLHPKYDADWLTPLLILLLSEFVMASSLSSWQLQGWMENRFRSYVSQELPRTKQAWRSCGDGWNKDDACTPSNSL